MKLRSTIIDGHIVEEVKITGGRAIKIDGQLFRDITYDETVKSFYNKGVT